MRAPDPVWLVAAGFALLIGGGFGACMSYANAPSHWPSRGPFIEVINDTAEPVAVVQHADGRPGILVTHRLWPNARVTFRWGYTDHAGMLLASPHNTMVFQPWSSSYWCWVISQPTVTEGKCK